MSASTQIAIAPRGKSWHGNALRNDELGALVRPAAKPSIDIEAAWAEALKIMTDAKKLLEKTGLEVSFITRCPDGAKWPVLMLEVGHRYADIEAVRNGKR